MGKKNMFDSEGMVAGMGWQTLALYIGISCFSIVYIATKLPILLSFIDLHITLRICGVGHLKATPFQTTTTVINYFIV